MALTAADVIARLELSPLPGEGGWFRQTWAAPDGAGTAIYYLVTDAPAGFSALHRLPTDEVYHVYLGDPVEQLLLHPDGRSEVVVLGQDIVAGQRVQHVVPAGVWQGTRLAPGGTWALLGTTMAPGFDASTYEHGNADALAEEYPSAETLIRAFVR